MLQIYWIKDVFSLIEPKYSYLTCIENVLFSLIGCLALCKKPVKIKKLTVLE